MNVYQWEIEPAIEEFWTCSITGDWDEFTWEDAFEIASDALEKQIGEHGMLGGDVLRNYVEEFFCEDDMLPEWALNYVHNGWVNLDADELLDIMFEYVAEQAADAFRHSENGDLEDLYYEVQAWESKLLTEKIELFDRIIHAEHVSGHLFPDLDGRDINAWRADFEEENSHLKPVPFEDQLI